MSGQQIGLIRNCVVWHFLKEEDLDTYTHIERERGGGGGRERERNSLTFIVWLLIIKYQIWKTLK